MQIMLRNGFGFDAEVVNGLPVWIYEEDTGPDDDPAIGIYDGFVIKIPFFTILIGSLQ